MEISETDKKLLKIASTFAMIIGVILSLSLLGVIIGMPSIMGAFYINSLMLCTKEEIKLNRDKILLWALFYFLTLNIITAGLLIFTYFKTTRKIETKVTIIEPVQNADETPEDKVNKLKLLKEQGLITEEDLEKLKNEVNKQNK